MSVALVLAACRPPGLRGPVDMQAGYLYVEPLMGTLETPACLDVDAQGTMRIHGATETIELRANQDERAAERGAGWTATRTSPAACTRAETSVETVKRRCGRVWPAGATIRDIELADDASGRAHVAFVVEHRGQQRVEYVRCGQTPHQQTLGTGGHVEAVALALGEDGSPVVAFAASGLQRPVGPLTTPGFVALARPEESTAYVYEPLLGLAAQQCAARYVDATEASTGPDYCGWLAEHQASPALRADSAFRDLCSNRHVGTTLEPACLMMAGISLGVPLVTTLRWRHAIGADGRQGPDVAMVTVFGDHLESVESSLSCHETGHPMACYQENIAQRIRHGDPGETRTYRAADGSPIDGEDGWDVASARCESGADPQACTSVAISWLLGRDGPPENPAPWADRAFSTLQIGCERGIAQACAQAWSIRWQEAATQRSLPEARFDTLLAAACRQGLTDACENLERLAQLRGDASASTE